MDSKLEKSEKITLILEKEFSLGLTDLVHPHPMVLF